MGMFERVGEWEDPDIGKVEVGLWKSISCML